ncbi:hypothetical protein ANRL3_02793 [Anaerolineae bacterium]|nr:hypothetical protein ANRL3_02793 [Anaerolineae bacterium]
MGCGQQCIDRRLSSHSCTPVRVTIPPRVAVEGYAGNQLLGGVVVDIFVPKYVPFAPYHSFLPLMRKQRRGLHMTQRP